MSLGNLGALALYSLGFLSANEGGQRGFGRHIRKSD